MPFVVNRYILANAAFCIPKIGIKLFIHIIKWEKQHEGITCEKFAEWKEDNDPEFQAEG